MKQISLRIDREQKAVRLDQFLASKLPNMSRTQAQKLIAAGMVCENGKPVKQSSHKTVPEALLEITIPYREEVKLVAQDIPLDILYEDDDLLVINKPAGLVVHPAFGNWDGTLANAVLHHLTVTQSSSLTAQSPERPGIIHRLDKDTSGIMVIAKNDCTKAYLQKQFQERTVQKTYIALVHGKLEPNSGLIDAPIGRDRKDRKKMTVTPTGKPAQTAYDVLEQYDGLQSYTLLKARLLTGRTHQIRVHCASIGFPIVGDMTYGRDTDTLKRQFLHAFSLTFKLPDGDSRTFEAPLSADLTGYLNSLK